MGTLVDLGYTAAGCLVIPTRGDAASLNGLTRAATRFVNIRRSTNPHLALLGVALFGFGTQDVKLVAKARTQLTDALAGIAPVLRQLHSCHPQGTRRHARVRSAGARVPRRSRNAPKWYQDKSAPRFSASADGLAEDYQRLSSEILTAYAERHRSASAAA